MTVSAKTQLVRTSMRIEKIEISLIRKLRMLQKKTMKVFIGPVLKEGRLNSIKTIYHLIRLFMESLKLFCFVSLAPMVCVSRAFVYDAVNVNKIISSTKPPSYPYAQVSTGLMLYLG